MSTLWTPSGEHPVPRKEPGTDPTAHDRAASPGGTAPGNSQGAAAQRSPAGGATRARGGASHDTGEYSEEELRQAAQEMDAVREQLLRAPVEVVIANHAMGLWELAALHLSQDPPGLREAKMAIDAMGSLLDGLAGQLGEAEKTLADGLSQLRMAFVQIANAGRAKDAPAP